MAKNLHDDFDSEQDLSKQFDSEPDLHAQFDAEPEHSSTKTEEAPVQAIHQDPQWSTAESFGQGALQGATMGYSDELGGLEGALMEEALGKTDPNKSFVDLYREYRQLHRDRNKQAADQHSVANLAGNITGGIATGLLTGNPTSMSGAVGMGGLMGLGTSNTDLTSGKMDDYLNAAEDTGIGMATGAASKYLGDKITSKLTPASRAEAGGLQISRSAGLIPKEAKDITQEQVAQIGQTAAEAGANPMTGGSRGTLNSVREAIDTQEQQLNPILKKAQAAIDADPQAVRQALGENGDVESKIGKLFKEFIYGKEQPDGTVFGGQTGRPDYKETEQEIIDKFGDFANRLKDADGNLAELNRMKQGLQTIARETGQYGTPKYNQNVNAFAKRLGGVVRQHIEDLANAADGESGKAIKEANSKLSQLYKYQDAVEKLVDKDAGKKGILSTKEALAGGAALAVHSPLALGLLGAKKGVELATGNPLSRTALQVAGRANLGLAKQLESSAAQKAVYGASELAKHGINNPFMTSMVQQSAPHLGPMYELYNADNDTLKNVSDMLRGNKTTENASYALDRYLQSGNSGDKAKALFLLQQNKDAIKLLKGESNE